MIRKISTTLFLFVLLFASYQSMATKWTFNTSPSPTLQWIATNIAVQNNDASGPHLGDTIVWQWTNGSISHNVKGISGPSAGWSSFGPLPLDTSHQSQMYVPTAAGQHAFECAIHPQMYSFFWMNSKLSVGHDLFEEAGITISPNPASTILTITSKMSNPVINLTNVIGKNIGEYHGVETSNGTTINVANIPSGTYFITLSSKEMVLTRRVVITH